MTSISISMTSSFGLKFYPPFYFNVKRRVSPFTLKLSALDKFIFSNAGSMKLLRSYHNPSVRLHDTIKVVF